MVRCEECRPLGLNYDVCKTGQLLRATRVVGVERDSEGAMLGRAAWGSVMRWSGTDGDKGEELTWLWQSFPMAQLSEAIVRPWVKR